MLGALFGRPPTPTIRTELIVFLTPRVIRNPDDARDVSEELRSRLKSLRPGGAQFATDDALHAAAGPTVRRSRRR